MTLIPYSEYRPDVADLNSQYSKTMVNVVPRGDGYGPFPDFVSFSVGLPGQSRGAFRAINTDGTVATFAATSTKLYQLNNTTFAWADVSLSGGSYAPLNSTDNWQFAQFGSLIFATQANAPLQVFNLISPATFTNAGGSPPQARYITVVGGFLVLSGLASLPFRVQWSGLYDVTSVNAWAPGVNSSDFQDIADGGIVRGVAGGDFGLIMQDEVLRSMTYLPGSPLVFQIERTAYDVGLYAPYSLIVTKNRIFFYSAAGFMGMQLTDAAPTPIGKERVDRTFSAALDASNLQLFIGASDPQSTRVLWGYKSTTGAANQFDSIIGYDWALDRWFSLSTSGEYLVPIAQPGMTLERLDSLTAFIVITNATNNGGGKVRLTVTSTTSFTTGQLVAIGQANAIVGTTEANLASVAVTVVDATHLDLLSVNFVHAYVSGGTIAGSLDALTVTLDSYPLASLRQVAAFSSSHALGFYSGPNLEAKIDTGEQDGGSQRLFVRGFRPITDAPAVYGSIGYRERQNAASTYSAESGISALGTCDLRKNTRYARGRVRIPYGTAWTFARGLDPDFTPVGRK